MAAYKLDGKGADDEGSEESCSKGDRAAADDVRGAARHN